MAHGPGTAVEFPVTVCATDAWMGDAARFFGPSADLSVVRIRSSRFVIGTGGTGWTCGDVIRFKRPTRPEDLPQQATVVHELTHVWEHQSGQAQLLAGVKEQLAKLFGRDPYDFGGPAGLSRRTRLTDFPKESQAEIVMELWRSENGAKADSRGVSFDAPGYMDDLHRLVGGAGIGKVVASQRSVMGRFDALVCRALNGVLEMFE
jgi:hypothetical protein